MSCEYCMGMKPLVSHDDEIGGIEARIDGNRLVIRFYEGTAFMTEEVVRIAHCPECGTEIISFE